MYMWIQKLIDGRFLSFYIIKVTVTIEQGHDHMHERGNSNRDGRTATIASPPTGHHEHQGREQGELVVRQVEGVESDGEVEE